MFDPYCTGYPLNTNEQVSAPGASRSLPGDTRDGDGGGDNGSSGVRRSGGDSPRGFNERSSRLSRDSRRTVPVYAHTTEELQSVIETPRLQIQRARRGLRSAQADVQRRSIEVDRLQIQRARRGLRSAQANVQRRSIEVDRLETSVIRNTQHAEVSRRMWKVAPLFCRQKDTFWSRPPTTPPTKRVLRTELEEPVKQKWKAHVYGPIRGVSWVPAKQKWKAYVEVIVNRQALGIVTKYVSTTALGFHKEKYDAVRAVDRALIVLSGEGAVTNYPLSDYVSDMEQLEMWTIEELQEALRTELYKEKHQGPWRAGLAPDPKDICRSSGPLGLPYSNSPSKKLSELQLNKACNELAKPRRVFIEDSNGKIESCERPPLPWRILKDEVAAEQAATDAKIAEEGGRTLADALADIAAPSISTDKGKKKKGPWKAGSLSDPSVVDYNAPTRDHPKIRNIHAERATSIIKQALFQKSDIGHATCALCPVPCDLCLRQKMRRAFQKWRLVTFYELETPQPEWRVPGAAPDLDCVYLSSPLEPHVPLSPSWDTPRNV